MTDEKKEPLKQPTGAEKKTEVSEVLQDYINGLPTLLTEAARALGDPRISKEKKQEILKNFESVVDQIEQLKLTLRAIEPVPAETIPASESIVPSVLNSEPSPASTPEPSPSPLTPEPLPPSTPEQTASSLDQEIVQFVMKRLEIQGDQLVVSKVKPRAETDPAASSSEQTVLVKEFDFSENSVLRTCFPDIKKVQQVLEQYLLALAPDIQHQLSSALNSRERQEQLEEQLAGEVFKALFNLTDINATANFMYTSNWGSKQSQIFALLVNSVRMPRSARAQTLGLDGRFISRQIDPDDLKGESVVNMATKVLPVLEPDKYSGVAPADVQATLEKLAPPLPPELIQALESFVAPDGQVLSIIEPSDILPVMKDTQRWQQVTAAMQELTELKNQQKKYEARQALENRLAELQKKPKVEEQKNFLGRVTNQPDLDEYQQNVALPITQLQAQLSSLPEIKMPDKTTVAQAEQNVRQQLQKLLDSKFPYPTKLLDTEAKKLGIDLSLQLAMPSSIINEFPLEPTNDMAERWEAVVQKWAEEQAQKINEAVQKMIRAFARNHAGINAALPDRFKNHELPAMRYKKELLRYVEGLLELTGDSVAERSPLYWVGKKQVAAWPPVIPAGIKNDVDKLYAALVDQK